MYKFIDLFCGMGGIRRGFELAGCECALSADIDKRAVKQYKHLFYEDCYNDVTSEEFKNKVANTDYDILCGGFPCQAFSALGSRQGFLDKTKGTLFFDCADILKRTRPKAFLFENVQGLLSHDRGKTFNTIFSILSELDYKLVGFTDAQQERGTVSRKASSRIIRNTFDFGLPQSRHRVYIIGFDRKRYKNNLKSFYDLPKSGKHIWSVDDVVALTPEEEFYYNDKSFRTIMKRGFVYESEFISEPLKTGYFSCITTSLIGKKSDIIRTGQRFRFPAVSELAMAQGFKGYGFMKNGKDLFSWEESLSRNDKIFLLGNSVSIPVIESMANMMVSEIIRLDKELL